MTTNSLEDIPSFSYASSEHNWVQRALIQSLESLTGQYNLREIYLQYRQNPPAEKTVFESALNLLGIDLNILDEHHLKGTAQLEGPLVMVANHPFGVLDGLIIGHLASQIRKDFKILTNKVLTEAPEIRPYVLPIDFSGTPEATETNRLSRAQALEFVKGGGLLVAFPSGGVSTTPTPFSKEATDADWKPFTARAILESKARVLPIYFRGQNSRFFQVASHVSQTLRLALLLGELERMRGSSVQLRLGDWLHPDDWSQIRDRQQLIQFLRNRVYGLRF